MAETPTETLLKTPLWDAHKAAGAVMGPFGGYDMPIRYPEGIIAEHVWTRTKAGLFDVSHMGPSFLTLRDVPDDPEVAHAAISALIETIVPSDIKGLKPGQIRYTVLLNAEGGVIDDLMIARPEHPDHQGMLYIVVNAGTKDNDFALIQAACGEAADLRRADDRALLALQGPLAASILNDFLPGVADMAFMTFAPFELDDVPLVVSRSGYTGEDGYEILVPADVAQSFVNILLETGSVKLIGLGARDSLRLEAGLCLYGHDMDEKRSPVEADIGFVLQKRRREAADFPGAARILAEFAKGPAQKRVGLKLLDKAPAREGAEIARADGTITGVVTSGGFGPTIGGPIAMGYVALADAAPGTTLNLMVRGTPRAAVVTALPFVPHTYFRKPAPAKP